jgi:hypothetical protein
LRVTHEAGAMAAMAPAHALRDQSLDRLPQQFVAAVSKKSFRLQIDQNDPPLLIDKDDPVGCGFCERAKYGVTYGLKCSGHD